MSNKNLLDSIKKLRELTGVGFKDCKIALDDSNGDIEKSIEFFRANSPIEEINANIETDRYIAWPGQACSYKMGQLKIEELRRKAEKELGENFDIRYFHDEVLCDGGITLPILENKINSFIAKYKS